jgi:hypothetical protein
MKKKWTLHVTTVVAFALFVALGLASGSSEPAVISGADPQAASLSVQSTQATPTIQYWTGSGGKDLSLAVLEPTGNGLATQDQWMLPLIQGSLTGDFNRYSAMTIIDRINLEKILSEQSQSMSGNYSDDDYIRIGRLTNAKLILTGSISKTANTLMMELSVTETESGVRKASYPPKSVSPASVENLSAVKEAAADLLEQLGITLTDRSLQSLKNPVSITVVQGQASLASVPTGQQTTQNQQQDTQTRLLDAQTQLSEVQAQIALAKGITAQKQGTVVEALSYFIQATNYNPALTEAASRMNTLNANISSGNIGLDARNDIEWRKRWIERLTETEQYFDNFNKTSSVPYTLFYSNEIKQGVINYQNETIDLSIEMNLRPNETWVLPFQNTLQTVCDGLYATEKSRDWGLSNWPNKCLTTLQPFEKKTYNFSITAELLNDRNKVIGIQTYNATRTWELRSRYSSKTDYTLTFTVKVDDITNNLVIRIASVNGRNVEITTRERILQIVAINKEE